MSQADKCEKAKTPPMTVAEAGRRGGRQTAERYGAHFYEEIGRKGGQAVKRLIERGKQAEKNEG